jgi:probable F420-dependent oxidoreductase
VDLQVHFLIATIGGMRLGEFGIWQPSAFTTEDMARDIEAMGYSALWLGGERPDLAHAEDILAATQNIVVGTSILSIWSGGAAVAAQSYLRLAARFQDRFLLGIGVGHPEQFQSYTKPMESLNQYLDVLDQQGVPKHCRALASLGPTSLTTARERSGGVVPYLVTPEHTRRARGVLGAGPLLAPEQKVVLGTDARQSRALARPRIKHPYLGLVNYTNNLRRLGFTEEDLAGDGSDRLIDELVVHGDAPAVAKGLRRHLDAGADHVQIQVIGTNTMRHPQVQDVILQVYDQEVFDTYRTLATALNLTPA